MIEYVKKMRKEYGNIPVIQLQLGRLVLKQEKKLLLNVLKLREQQRLLPESIDNCYVISTINEELSDYMNLNESSQKNINTQINDIVKKHNKTIEIEDISFKKSDSINAIDISVRFKNLNGNLKSCGVPTGFYLTKNKYEPEFDVIYDIWFCENTVMLRAELTEDDMKDMYIYYGLGLNPYCNIIDEQGRSIPAFGPIKLG